MRPAEALWGACCYFEDRNPCEILLCGDSLTLLRHIDINSGCLSSGALVLLLSIAADPFTQQLIQYERRVVYTDSADTTVNRAGRLSKGKRAIKYSTENVFGESDRQVGAVLGKFRVGTR